MGNYERAAGSGRFVTQTELEKALGGMGGSNDSGVGSRLLGSLLTWLSDHTSDVFVVMTANDISALPPELTRSGRWTLGA